MKQYEQEIRLNNFKAQYESVLGNVKIANQLLEDILSRKLQAEKELEKVNKELKSKKDEVFKLVLSLTEHKEMINDYLIDKDKIVKEIRGLFEGKEIVKEEILNARKTANEYQSSIKKEIDLLLSKRDAINKDISNKKEVLSSVKEELAATKKELSSQFKSLSADIKEKELALKDITIQINNGSKELDKLQKEIAYHKDKIQSPLEFIKQKEIEFGKKERNLNTLIRRFKVYWEKEYPDRELKI